MPFHRKVLIADDDFQDRQLIERCLVNLHCEFEIADNLEEARFRTTNFEPAIVLLDLNLPLDSNRGGAASIQEVASFIRSIREKQAVVIVTGNLDEKNISIMMDAGACDFLEKSKLSNRAEFESRVIQAYALHNALVLKEGNARIEHSLNTLRANQDVMMRRQKLEIEKTGDLQTKKDELFKKQIREAAIKERDKYWNKRIFALGNIIVWLFVFLGKLIMEKLGLRK